MFRSFQVKWLRCNSHMGKRGLICFGPKVKSSFIYIELFIQQQFSVLHIHLEAKSIKLKKSRAFSNCSTGLSYAGGPFEMLAFLFCAYLNIQMCTCENF